MREIEIRFLLFFWQFNFHSMSLSASGLNNMRKLDAVGFIQPSSFNLWCFLRY